MTRDQKLLVLKKLVIAYAEYWRENLADSVVAMYAEDLMECDLEDLKQVLMEIRRDRKITRLPIPAEILNRLRPQLTDDQIARESAARVGAAVSRFGWNNHERAREYVGELGWEIVKRHGGWAEVARTYGVTSSIDTSQAQWRELAKSILDQKRAGVLGTAPALPTSREGQKRIADIVSGATKRLGGGEADEKRNPEG